MSETPSFFSELKRRNVYKVAVAYAVVGWLLIQIATQVFPFLEIPNWIVRLVIALVALGFPIALFLAWVFEMTPQGLKRTEEIDRAAPPARSNAWIYIVIVGVLLSVGVFFLGRYSAGNQKAALPDELSSKSIAVLPFENFSDDKENAFFADGIQDDILTSLAQIAELRVISRSSVAQFRGEKRNLREIGRILNVANILEGSVRRAADRVVVSVQLIDAVHDRHLWANRYDRLLVDSLGLQGELASEIAGALRVTLTPNEKAGIENKPTQNPDAYVLYLRANQIERNPDTLLEDYKTADELYRQAIAADPAFALAHARLASTCAAVFHFYEPTELWKNRARSSAETALRLRPDLAEGHLALGQCLYWIERDYAGAVEQFDIASRFAPGNAEVPRLMAAIKRRQGRWEESLASYERVGNIDPQNPAALRELLFTNGALRRWSQASIWAERMRQLVPASIVAKAQSGYIDFWWKGDTGLLKSLVGQIPPDTDPDGAITALRWEIAMIERDFGLARSVLQQCRLTEVSYTNAGTTPVTFLQGCVDLASGDPVSAQNWFEKARPDFEKAVEEAPTSADRHANLGWCYAFMGRKADAIRAGRRAVELKPESKDAVDGVIMNCYLALIYARVNENDLAFPLIERLLQTPGSIDSADYSITVNDLKFRWEWDPIRNDPRFQKLIAAAEAAEKAQSSK